MRFDRIDVENDDVVGSFLDCGWWDRVDITPPGGAIVEPTPPAYFTANLPWIHDTDEIDADRRDRPMDRGPRGAGGGRDGRRT